jgi:DNA-binding CsgD family transcriptional regulator
VATAALLQQLCSAGIALLATVRHEGVADPFVLGLWTEGVLERLDIGPFSAGDSNKLIDVLLGTPVSASVHREMFALASGNPLLTRELIADGRHCGALVEEEGTWKLIGPLRAEQRVSDLFAARLDALDSEQREALELVALAELVPVAILQELTTEIILEQLQSSGLIEVVDGQVRCDHPMLGEVTRRGQPSLRTDRLVGRLIDAIVSSPVSSPKDVLRAVRWQLQRGDTPTPTNAAVAAQTALAIFDGVTAVQCAEAACVPDSAEAHVLLGRARFLDQQLEAAVGEFQRGSELATTDAERAMTAVAWSEALAFGTGDFAGASTVLEHAMAANTEPSHRATVAASLALVRGLTGDFDFALAHGDEFLDSPDIEPAVRLKFSIMWTLAATATGQFDHLQQRLDSARALAHEMRSQLPAALDQILVTQFMFHLGDGRFSEAMPLAEEQRAIAERDHRITAVWDQSMAVGELFAGRGASAVGCANQAVTSISASDPIGLRSLALATKAMVAAYVGDLPTAIQAYDLSIADPRCGPREQAYLGRACANVLALEGDLDNAVVEARARARAARDNSVWAAWTLYDAVRFDRAADVAADLLVVASKAPVEIVLAMNDHCDGLVAGNAALLTKAAKRLERAGLLHFAAEAAAHAARQLGMDGDPTSASLMALRSLALFDRCDSLRSLAVEALERPLTDREYEIARAAGSGKASQAIADELFVSRRTVENHLQNAFRKLGINQRDELVEVFTTERRG